MPNERCNNCGALLKQEKPMMHCRDCPRIANVKLTVRDVWQRVHTIWLCDEHAKGERLVTDESRKEYMEKKYGL